MRLPWIGELSECEIEWQPVSRGALVGWMTFYAVMLWSVATASTFPFFDMVWTPIHEGGHVLFSYLGQTLGVAGGTLLQLIVPIGLLIHFVLRGHTTGSAFCSFFLFESFIGIGIYMADSRTIALDYLTIGDGSDFIHDWQFMFTKLGVLDYDTKIGAFVKGVGWLGMLATLAWLAWMHVRTKGRVKQWEPL